jgi:hypothetical protein
MGMPNLRREKVEVEYDGVKYEFWVRELVVKDYLEVVRAGLGNQGKVRTVVGEPPVIDFDIVGYSYELVKRSVENFGEFGSVDGLPQAIYNKLAERAMELNPFPALFAGGG